jgi:hypothetical protein
MVSLALRVPDQGYIVKGQLLSKHAQYSLDEVL